MKDYESVAGNVGIGNFDHLPHHLYAQLNVEQLALEPFTIAKHKHCSR